MDGGRRRRAGDAALRCEQQIDEVDPIINDLRSLGRERRFGNNDHGHQVRRAFKDAAVGGENSLSGCYVSPRGVLRDMASTFRHAGRAAAAEPANQQMSSSGAS